MRNAKVKQAQFNLDQKRNLKLQTEQALMMEIEQTKSEFQISDDIYNSNSNYPQKSTGGISTGYLSVHIVSEICKVTAVGIFDFT